MSNKTANTSRKPLFAAFGLGVAGAVFFYRTRPSKAPCVEWGEGQPTGSLDSTAVTESSGIARASGGNWWTHNDSGGKPSLYAFSQDGRFLGESNVTGANFNDWEGLARGKCPSGILGGYNCLYIADFGDNNEKRSSVQIYAVKEPKVGKVAPVIATWNVTYPDRPHNAEALLVSPKGEIFIVTKETRGEGAFVFKLPRLPGDVVAEQVGLLKGFVGNRKITGGSWSPDGKSIVLLTYGDAYVWKVKIGGSVNWDQQPTPIRLAKTKKAEAIDFDKYNNVIATSEGNPMPIQIARCTKRSLAYQGAWWGGLMLYAGGLVLFGKAYL